MPDPLTWIDALAIFHGGTTLGLATIVTSRYLRGPRRAPMLLLCVAYSILTILNVRAIVVWGTADSPWFWASLVAWLCGDAGLGLHLVFGRIPGDLERRGVREAKP